MPAPVTVEDLRAALDRMQLERAEAEAVIWSAPGKRAELLRAEGTDPALKRLERDVDAAHLQVERIDLLRPELEQRIAALQVETRDEAWYAMRSRLVEQLLACEVACRDVDRMVSQLMALRLEASNAGYELEVEAVPNRRFEVAGADHCADLARHIANRRPVHLVARPLWNVKFREFTIVSLGREAFPTAYQGA